MEYDLSPGDVIHIGNAVTLTVVAVEGNLIHFGLEWPASACPDAGLDRQQDDPKQSDPRSGKRRAGLSASKGAPPALPQRSPREILDSGGGRGRIPPPAGTWCRDGATEMGPVEVALALHVPAVEPTT
jgi:hypothetical protein